MARASYEAERAKTRRMLQTYAARHARHVRLAHKLGVPIRVLTSWALDLVADAIADGDKPPKRAFARR